MKQIVQNARSGALECVEVPAPAPDRGQILVKTAYSVMSPGTERMAMDFARKSLVGKARSRPDLVKQVTRKLAQEGPIPTIRTVVNRLDAPQPLGYASAGVVEAVGESVRSVAPGDRVACAGAGYANHAELVVVPENLTAHVPEGLGLDRAAFATLGAIAMQGLRVGDPKLGEVVVVIGLGLIGQLTVQLLLANGCRVYGVDLDERRIANARQLGMDWGASPADDHSVFLASAAAGHGADLAIVTAASDSSEPIRLAAELCRHKGRVVAVGATAMELDRRVFYEKELELRMSMSYGPGRYDRRYEELGLDYPLAYVRWTEQRNLQAFIDLAARGSLDPLGLDIEVVDFERAPDVYESLAKKQGNSLAALFRYPEVVDRSRIQRVAVETARRIGESGDLGVAFVGAGNYAKSVLLPALKRIDGLARRTVITATGASARRTAERFEFERCGTDPAEVLSDDQIDLVFVTTRHDSHASLAVSALRAGKAVWLEKPVGLTREEVDDVARAAVESGSMLMVGFNRRFSRHARLVAERFQGRTGPMSIQYVVAAGVTPTGSWLTDPDVGGGRVVGEVCHFVDLCNFLVGEEPRSVFGTSLSRDDEIDDSVSATIRYPDGSVANLSYLAGASPELPKERWEVHADGKSATCENFRTTTFAGGEKIRAMNQDKGQQAAVAETIAAVRFGPESPIPLSQIVSASRTTFGILESIRSDAPVSIDHGS